MPPRGRRGGSIGRETAAQRRQRERRRNAPQNQNVVNFRNLQSKFEEELQKLQPCVCSICLRFVITNKPFEVCCHCKKNRVKFTADNHMDPKDVPPELQDLSYVEQLLIARVQPVMRVYRVRSRGLPGQYAYKGNIINVGQNLTEIARSLPRTPSSLSTVVVRKDSVSGHRDFHVRRDKVLNAIRFLKSNNPFYADINIVMENLSQLPQNGSIFDMISTVDLPEINSNEEQFSEEIYESLVPNNILISEVDRLQCAVKWI